MNGKRGEIKMAKYAITVDYYMWDDEKKEECTKKHYLYTMGEHKIYVFHETTDAEDDLKTFATRGEALTYIAAHNLSESCCYENVRVERI